MNQRGPPLVYYDELATFTEEQFDYLLQLTNQTNNRHSRKHR